MALGASPFDISSFLMQNQQTPNAAPSASLSGPQGFGGDAGMMRPPSTTPAGTMPPGGISYGGDANGPRPPGGLVPPGQLPQPFQGPPSPPPSSGQPNPFQDPQAGIAQLQAKFANAIGGGAPANSPATTPNSFSPSWPSPPQMPVTTGNPFSFFGG